MMSITKEELNKAMSLYDETKKYQYGSIRNRAARNRYETYIKSLAEKYSQPQGNIHTRVIMERRRQRVMERNKEAK